MPVDSHPPPPPWDIAHSQETAYVLSKCIVCGCLCWKRVRSLKIELAYRKDETHGAVQTPDSTRPNLGGYVGAFAIPGQVRAVQSEPDVRCSPPTGWTCWSARGASRRAVLRRVRAGLPSKAGAPKRYPARACAATWHVVR